MLRHIEDARSVLWVVIATTLLVVQWNLEEFNIFLWVTAIYFSISISTVVHNHNHTRIWKNKWLNRIQDYWLTVLYGFPVFAWIPTHNKNHHKFNNREGDYTITYRFSEKNNIFTMLSYPTISSYFQQGALKDYLKMLWTKRRTEFAWCIGQYVFLAAWLVTAFVLDWKKALLYVVVPQQASLFAVLVFNYLQHVHTDELSENNHSRNIVSPVFNFFMFNNGYHTIHHDMAGLHWSKTAAEFKKIEHKVDPSLNEKSFWWLLIRSYILGPFIPSLGTHSMRLDRIHREEEESSDEPNLDHAASAA